MRETNEALGNWTCELLGKRYSYKHCTANRCNLSCHPVGGSQPDVNVKEKNTLAKQKAYAQAPKQRQAHVLPEYLRKGQCDRGEASGQQGRAQARPSGPPVFGVCLLRAMKTFQVCQ